MDSPSRSFVDNFASLGEARGDVDRAGAWLELLFPSLAAAAGGVSNEVCGWDCDRLATCPPPPARPENTVQSGDLVPSDLQTDLGRVSCPLH